MQQTSLTEGRKSHPLGLLSGLDAGPRARKWTYRGQTYHHRCGSGLPRMPVSQGTTLPGPERTGSFLKYILSKSVYSRLAATQETRSSCLTASRSPEGFPIIQRDCCNFLYSKYLTDTHWTGIFQNSDGLDHSRPVTLIAVQEHQPQQDLLGCGALPLGHPYFLTFHFEEGFNGHRGSGGGLSCSLPPKPST